MNGPILYVDDDEANLVVLRAALGAKLPILTARSGEEALALLGREEISVLLSDQRMPGMTGVELAARVRELQPDAARMLVTAWSDLDAAIEAINRGNVHRYLRKPWEPGELTQALVDARERWLLGRRVRELEARFVETERVYALGVAAAGLAHELRNPLGTIRVHTELARDELGTLVPRLERDEVPRGELLTTLRELQEWFVDIDAGGKTILEILRGVELSTRSTERGEVELGEVVSLTLRLVRAQGRRVGRIEAHLREVPRIVGSRTRLGQLVLNLVLNALEALDPRRSAENVVSVRLDLHEGRVRLEVEDNGSGMSAETAARIFEPFFTTKQKGGTGLGLAICHKIAEEHGGTISLHSTPGVGTTFTVALPPA